MQKGFSLIEILVVIGLITLIAAGGYMISIGGFQRYAFSAERDLVLNLLQKTRSRAMNNVLQSPHSLVISDTEYTLFSDDGDTDNDDIFPRNTSVVISPTTIEFEQLSGNVVMGAGVINIDQGVQSAQIEVNTNGRISWQYD